MRKVRKKRTRSFEKEIGQDALIIVRKERRSERDEVAERKLKNYSLRKAAKAQNKVVMLLCSFKITHF
jgi:hypothetical protein